MRLALVVPGFGASDEDWCIPALSSYAKALSEKHSVRVFALRAPHRRARYRAHGVEVFPLAGGEARGLSRLPLLARAARGIAREHRRIPFDVLHAFWADEPGYVVVHVGRHLGVPTLVSVAGGELVTMPEIGYGGLTSRLNRYLVRSALRGANRVAVGSTSLGLRVEGGYRTVTYLPLGVDTSRFRPGPGNALPGGSPKLLHVASLTAVKDQTTLWRAIAIARRDFPQLVLHVLGDGPERSRLERLAAELDLTEHVAFHGAVPHETLTDYYRSADLLVTSSLHEAQGMAVLEAAACGLPAVGTASGVLADLEPASVAVSVRDPEGLASAIVSLSRDEKARRAMGARAAERVRERFSLPVAVSSFESVYQELGTTRYRRRTSFRRSRSATASTV